MLGRRYRDRNAVDSRSSSPVATPDGFDDVGVEPGTGTAVILDLPETATAGEELRIPLEIRAVVAINGLSRCATVLTDIPHDELRERSVDLALNIVAGGS